MNGDWLEKNPPRALAHAQRLLGDTFQPIPIQCVSTWLCNEGGLARTNPPGVFAQQVCETEDSKAFLSFTSPTWRVAGGAAQVSGMCAPFTLLCGFLYGFLAMCRNACVIE